MDNEYATAQYYYLKSLAEVFTELVAKSAVTSLGPADGKLYMQICDTLTVHAELLEEVFRANLRQVRRYPGGASQEDSGPEGDRPPDSGA